MGQKCCVLFKPQDYKGVLSQSTILSHKYHAIVFNTHARFEARKSGKKVCWKFVVDRDCGAPTLREGHIEDREGRTAPEIEAISPAMLQIYRLICHLAIDI